MGSQRSGNWPECILKGVREVIIRRADPRSTCSCPQHDSLIRPLSSTTESVIDGHGGDPIELGREALELQSKRKGIKWHLALAKPPIDAFGKCKYVGNSHSKVYSPHVGFRLMLRPKW